MLVAASLFALSLLPLNCAAQLHESNTFQNDDIRITRLFLGFAVQKAAAEALGCPSDLRSLRKALKDYFGTRVSTWKLTVQQNGELSNIALYKPSGSDEIDQKAKRILSSTSSIKNHTGMPIKFVISFPAISPAEGPITEATSIPENTTSGHDIQREATK